jgi:hypothetical protein
MTSGIACARGGEERAPAATVSSAEFQQLRWLEGNWRGSGGGFDQFYESYRWVDDSTIRKYDFPDSTLATPSDSSELTLRNGVVRNGSPARSWVLSSLDSARAVFVPERNANNGFEWIHTAPGSWTARLTWDSAGVPRDILYEMRSWSPPARTPF